jgi:hypothetical protein
MVVEILVSCMANTRALLSIWSTMLVQKFKKIERGLFLFLRLWLPLFLNVGA